MANSKITELTALTDPASTDVLPIVDVTADATKKVTIADLLENAGAGTASAPAFAFDGDSNTGIYRPGADQVAISTNGTGRLFVDSSGRVMIGTTTEGNSSAETLTIAETGNSGMTIRSGATSNGSIFFSDSTSGDGESEGQVVYNHQTNMLTLVADVSRYMRWDSAGRLLLNTASPGADGAHVLTIDNATGDDAGITIRSGTSNAGNIFFSDATSGSGEYDGFVNYRHNERALRFGTAATERFRVDDSGRIKIGTTSNGPDLFTTGSGAVFSDTQALLVGRSGVNAIFNRHSSDGEIVRFHRQGSDVGSIDVTTSATTYNTSSDYRLKENVIPISDGIARVKQLSPKRFNFIVDADTTVDGFLAHEAQSVVPEAVTGAHNEVDNEGNPVMQGIDHSKLVPLLTAALQEAITKIEALETKVAALEASQ